jgi:hypothetical protein
VSKLETVGIYEGYLGWKGKAQFKKVFREDILKDAQLIGALLSKLPT